MLNMLNMLNLDLDSASITLQSQWVSYGFMPQRNTKALMPPCALQRDTIHVATWTKMQRKRT